MEVALGIRPEDGLPKKWRSTPNRAATLAQRLTADKEARVNLWGMIDVAIAGQHATYLEILLLGLVEEAELARMVKFAVCRNPYDRAVATFGHMGTGYENTPEGFKAFWRTWPQSRPINHNDRAHRRNQWEYCVGLDGQSVLDRLIRYESLNAEFETFTAEVTGETRRLPWHGQSRKSGSYRDYYDAESTRLIADRYAKDFDFFGYSTEL